MKSKFTLLEIQAINLIESAVSLPRNEQNDFLLRKTKDNAELRERVFSIYQKDTLAHNPLITGIALDYIDQTSIPSTIGPYKIESELGSGGMGSVYLGRKISDDFEFRAAIKVVRKDIDSERLIARLKSERRTLANLRHQNIAHFYDGGETENGNPYFVMEYVKGSKLIEYIEEHSLSQSELLTIFQEICSAVAFAHQNLVIHRDLTPSNILVSEDRIVKLIDFGIAHSLNDSVDENTSNKTGTSGYVAPERNAGKQASTITDIYSLGVILMQISQHINMQQKSDLLAIAERASSMDPQARYQSVDALLRDIRKYENGEAVEAVEQTWSYLLKRFFQRHRILVSSISSALVLLIISTVAISVSYLRAEAAEERSSKRFEEVRELASFMMFDLYDEVVKLDTSLTAREMLVKRTLTYLDDLSDLPEAGQELGVELALGYQRMANIAGGTGAINLGERNKAETLYARANQQISSALSVNPNDPETIRAYSLIFRNIGTFEWINNLDFAKAQENFYLAKLSLKKLVDSDSATIDDKVMDGALSLSLSQSARNVSDFVNAISWAEQAITKLSELHTQYPEHYETQFNLAHAYIYLGEAITSKIEEQGGDLRAALPSFGDGKYHLKQIIAPSDSPTLAKAQYLTALYKRSAVACQLEGERKDAIADLEVAETLAKKLLEGEAQNNFVNERLLSILETRANCELLNNNLEQAISFGSDLLLRRKAKMILTPDNLLYISRLISTLSILGQASHNPNDTKNACSYFVEAEKYVKKYKRITERKPYFALQVLFENVQSGATQCKV